MEKVAEPPEVNWDATVASFRTEFTAAIKEYFRLLAVYNKDRGQGLNRTHPNTWKKDGPPEQQFESGIELLKYQRDVLEPLKRHGRKVLKLDLCEEFARVQGEV